MNRQKLQIAVLEARRFIARAEALPTPEPYDCGYSTLMRDNFPREQGAIKRASMDLTRALADLRRPER
ncbi:hypothetical protein AGRO_3688 [Agrobacterium sp. ATCC 31749]|uniref:hypothetical protein n=1 Tax=unclassified Agrobacterium TaxID=2632611 RepID=UPI00020DB74D|nr:MULTISPECIES: hypothetical protein [unclassified Agrobacterium]EGL63619.1 hypothetical protein AGRO_3688 [Agrobacterium sp. ATCC 31749]QKW97072.1 hypothetical protein GSF67_08220 [Agrobacterium sp. CGMCC 11546]